MMELPVISLDNVDAMSTGSADSRVSAYHKALSVKGAMSVRSRKTVRISTQPQYDCPGLQVDVDEFLAIVKASPEHQSLIGEYITAVNRVRCRDLRHLNIMLSSQGGKSVSVQFNNSVDPKDAKEFGIPLTGGYQASRDDLWELCRLAEVKLTNDVAISPRPSADFLSEKSSQTLNILLSPFDIATHQERHKASQIELQLAKDKIKELEGIIEEQRKQYENLEWTKDDQLNMAAKEKSGLEGDIRQLQEEKADTEKQLAAVSVKCEKQAVMINRVTEETNKLSVELQELKFKEEARLKLESLRRTVSTQHPPIAEKHRTRGGRAKVKLITGPTDLQYEDFPSLEENRKAALEERSRQAGDSGSMTPGGGGGGRKKNDLRINDDLANFIIPKEPLLASTGSEVASPGSGSDVSPSPFSQRSGAFFNDINMVTSYNPSSGTYLRGGIPVDCKDVGCSTPAWLLSHPSSRYELREIMSHGICIARIPFSIWGAADDDSDMDHSGSEDVTEFKLKPGTLKSGPASFRRARHVSGGPKAGPSFRFRMSEEQMKFRLQYERLFLQLEELKPDSPISAAFQVHESFPKHVATSQKLFGGNRFSRSHEGGSNLLDQFPSNSSTKHRESSSPSKQRSWSEAMQIPPPALCPHCHSVNRATSSPMRNHPIHIAAMGVNPAEINTRVSHIIHLLRTMGERCDIAPLIPLLNPIELLAIWRLHFISETAIFWKKYVENWEVCPLMSFELWTRGRCLSDSVMHDAVESIRQWLMSGAPYSIVL